MKNEKVTVAGVLSALVDMVADIESRLSAIEIGMQLRGPTGRVACLPGVGPNTVESLRRQAKAKLLDHAGHVST